MPSLPERIFLNGRKFLSVTVTELSAEKAGRACVNTQGAAQNNENAIKPALFKNIYFIVYSLWAVRPYTSGQYIALTQAGGTLNAPEVEAVTVYLNLYTPCGI